MKQKKANLTVREAARLMGGDCASEEFIRRGLQQGRFPWGYAVKTSARWTYWISREKFEKCTGIKVD